MRCFDENRHYYRAGNAPDSHHAFHIDPDKFDSSLQFLEDKGVEIILVDERKKKAVVTGRSIYFPDPDGNVLELVDMYAIQVIRTELLCRFFDSPTCWVYFVKGLLSVSIVNDFISINNNVQITANAMRRQRYRGRRRRSQSDAYGEYQEAHTHRPPDGKGSCYPIALSHYFCICGDNGRVGSYQ